MRETTLISQVRRVARVSATPVAAVVGAGTFMAFLAPFGSSDMSWPALWAYWVGLMAIGGGGGALAGNFTTRRAAHLPELVQWIMIAAAAAVPVTLAVFGLQWGANGRPPPPVTWPALYFYVFLVSAAVSGVMFLVTRLSNGGARQPNPGASGSRAPFLDRLPPKLKGARVLAVQAEDHYLRVHTSAGDDLILLRLADAERELESLDGLRVHRSWWVARDAVADVTRADGRMTLKLVNGVEAPVSRTYARAVRDAGWT